MIKADKLKNLILYILLISGFVFGGKEKLKVSLIMSDSNLKNTHKAVEMIFEQYPELRNQIDFKSYRGKKLRSQDLEFFSKSKLVFIWIHGFDSNVEKVQSEIEKIVKNGGKVYALGTSPAEEKYRDLGILFNKTVLKYGRAGGKTNIANLIKNRLSKDFGFKLKTGKVVNYPESGIYDHHTDSLYTDVKTYFENYREYAKENPTIGFVVERSKITTEQTKHFKAVFNSVERFGFNVLPIFGMPVDKTIKKFFLDKENNPIVDIIVPFSMWHGVNPDKVRPLFEKIGVPVINSVQLFNSEEKWLQSEKGIDIWQRTLLVAIPELMGLIQPTVTSSKEKIEGSKEENNYFDQKPIMRRVKVLRDRILGWYYLQKKKNSEKKIALLYYSYPPGKENIGASYLNVLPNSIFNILKEFEKNNYNLGGKELIPDSIYTQVMSYGRNVGSWAGGEIENVVATGKPILVPVKEYKKWFSELDSKLRKSVTDYWGAAESSEEMIWRDAKGNSYLVISGVKYGNILLAPQPARGAGQDAEKLYHDVKVPPNHQYIAFYLYLQKSFRSDAIIHLGTHGTHEWLSGKEVGQDDKDPSDALIKGIPNIYPYVVDDVGEGLQAKRRGMAVIIDHMTPPFDKAGLNPELEKLTELINDHNVAESKSPLLKTAKLREINSIAIGTGIIKDLGVDSVKTEEEIHELEHYLKEILEKKTPFGLHTFGKVPEEKYIKSTAEAMVSVTTGLSAKKKKELTKEFDSKIRQSAKRELQSLINALNGKMVPTGKGGDPIRNPNALPTGKNFYAFDPSKIPSKAVYKLGAKMADELLKTYRSEKGSYPEKLTFNLWSTECIRHEGVQESQILYLLGIKPKWNERGKVTGLEVIPRHILKRPRIDVVMIPSGLYRDIFSNLMQFLDKAVGLAKKQDEKDNFVRQHIETLRKQLIGKGVDKKLADRLASVRMFSVAPGNYGTGMEDVIEASGTWEKEEEVVSVFFNRMSHLYGQGFWGDKAEEKEKQLDGINFSSKDLFKSALKDVKISVHSRSTNLYGTLDNDDFYQYLGSTAMAVRSVNGESPEVYVTNLSDPSNPRQESLNKFMGREMRSRYLNPAWINKMMDEGYSGARFIKRVVSHLWGWQVTVPEAVDETKWQEMYEVYVEDKFDLDIKEKFEDADNLWAYQNILARMIEVTRKEYWNPDKEVVEKLTKEFVNTVEKVGLACSGNICDNKKLSDAIVKNMEQIPGLKAKVDAYNEALTKVQNVQNIIAKVPDPAQLAKTEVNKNLKELPQKTIEGLEVTEVNKKSNNENRNVIKEPSVWIFVLLIIFVYGWYSKSKKRNDTIK